MYFQRVKTKGLGHSAYILGCGDGKAVVVDPRRDVDEYLALARESNLTITHVLETHRQEDFEFGSRHLADLTGAKVVTGRHELFGDADLKLGDGEALKVGTTRFVALETPGHTPESLCWAVYVKDAGDTCWAVFTGDTLFVGETGRTDLPGPDRTAENAGLLHDAVHAKLTPLGDQAIVLPAHGSGSACGGNISDRDETTLGIERRTNRVYRMTREEFMRHKAGEHLPRPPYFRHMEKVNLGGGRPPPRAPRVLQPKDFRDASAEGVVIDTREPDAFAGAHIPGAYNIWLGGLSTFGGWIVHDGPPIWLVVEQPAQAEAAVAALARVGIDSVQGVLLQGVDGWREAGLPIATLATTGAADIAPRVKAGEVKVLDVRDDGEHAEKHIPGAMHVYVGVLESQLPQVPKDAPLVVHCSVGHRSGLAASILQRHGYTGVVNLLGGLTAWEKLGLPLDKAR